MGGLMLITFDAGLYYVTSVLADIFLPKIKQQFGLIRTNVSSGSDHTTYELFINNTSYNARHLYKKGLFGWILQHGNRLTHRVFSTRWGKVILAIEPLQNVKVSSLKAPSNLTFL